MPPRLKVIRRLGTPLPGLTRKRADRRPYPPGMHGPTARRRKSDYRRQLEEKQKVRFHYGVSETQLRRALGKTERDESQHGGTRLEMLERRLTTWCSGWVGRKPFRPPASSSVTGTCALTGAELTGPDTP
jgi:small subunit ribosomal protein S4